MYLVAWIHNRSGDKSVDVYSLASGKLGDFKTRVMNSICKHIGMDGKTRKKLETSLVGFIEIPVVSIEIINGDFHFAGKVWRS